MRVSVQWAPDESSIGADATAVVLDVLRATTSLTVAIESGASRVLPAATIEQAFALKRAHPDAWLCGEREGRKVERFDRGNSPFEYAQQDMVGRTLIFASTNGSRAMLAAHRARRCLLGAFVNAAAVVEAVSSDAIVVLVCAGKLGRFAYEDAACAGWLCARLADRGAELVGAAARCALALAPTDADGVFDAVAGSMHGRYLRTLGAPYARDVAFAGKLDTIDRAFTLTG